MAQFYGMMDGSITAETRNAVGFLALEGIAAVLGKKARKTDALRMLERLL